MTLQHVRNVGRAAIVKVQLLGGPADGQSGWVALGCPVAYVLREERPETPLGFFAQTMRDMADAVGEGWKYGPSRTAGAVRRTYVVYVPVIGPRGKLTDRLQYEGEFTVEEEE